MMESKSRLNVENGLVALNQVHSLAAKLWSEKIPAETNYRQKQKPNKPCLQRRITPVQLPRRDSGGYSSNDAHYDQSQFWNRQREQEGPGQSVRRHQQPLRQVLDFDSNSNRKRAQIKSLPLKPPDIQNINLFPPIDSTQPANFYASNSTGTSKSNSNDVNPFATTFEEAKFDPKQERKKIFSGVQKVQTQIGNGTPEKSSPPLPTKILKRQSSDPPSAQKPQAETRSVAGGRSAELFAQLTLEKLDELKKLSSAFSESLDSNLCRSILAELTLLCQLLVANNDDEVTSSFGNSRVLAALAPRVWFVTKIFELQLPLISKISPDVIQMLIDFYPHRIPKQIRKKFELIIQSRFEGDKQSASYHHSSPNRFSSCVVFQTETDGRGNFPHQKDCQDFGKQRDLFYAIREIWASRQVQNSSSNPMSPNTFDPAYSKVKQLFTINSSSTNLSRLASLFLSQSLLDLNATEVDNNYDPSSFENVQRILETNPSKYEKLRQRLFASSNSTFEGNQPILDPMAFLQYFVSVFSSFEFIQYLIDHIIYDIQKVELEASNEISAAETQSLMRKTYLLGQMLGFLWYLPYRDDSYKKPISPINVEVYLRSQIALRSHQTSPLNLTEILTSSMKQKRLVFTLPWIIELLSRADQVTFHLPAYNTILTLIACIYRELLPVGDQTKYPVSLSSDNKTLLRFQCGKLFGLPNFPDMYLFGTEVKTLNKFIPDFSCPLSPKPADETLPLDLTDSIGSTFLSIWFRIEMKQIITILSTNATVRGSIPSESPGIVKHIRPVPETTQRLVDSPKKSQPNSHVQADLENRFFLIHPSSVKKTVDFVSERIFYDFMKQLRRNLLVELRVEFAQNGIFGQSALNQCRQEVEMKIRIFSTQRCSEAVNLLLGNTISPAVLSVCQKICVRHTVSKVLEWVSHHVTIDLFPEVPGMDTSFTEAATTAAETSAPFSAATGSFFLVLWALHNTIQRLHNGLAIDEGLIDRILDDPRLVLEKPWITHRSFDLAVTLLTFSPSALTPDRQSKFISFWKKIKTDQFGSILSSRNILLFSMSATLELTFQKLGCLVKALLREKLLSTEEIQGSCMTLLQENWPSRTKSSVSQFLQEVISDMDPTEEREIVDWISWYCSENGDAE